MPNVVRQTTSGTAATVEAVGVGWADEDAADVADCIAAWLDGEAVTGADTFELVAVEHADTSTADAADTTKTANREHLRPMSALSAPCPGGGRLDSPS